MFGKLREKSFKRAVTLDGHYKINRFNIELDVGHAYRLKKDGTFEKQVTNVLKVGETYGVTMDASIDCHKFVFEGQVNPAIARNAHVTLSNTYITPADHGAITPSLIVTPVFEIKLEDLAYGVRYYTEFSTYPSWDQ